MISKVFYITSLMLLLALVNCEPPIVPPSTQYGTPISSYGTPNYNADHHNQDYSAPKSYEFGYQVKDDYTGNNYKRQEASDGNQVQGEYRVQLPDGRTQIVTYYADWQTGFHADVRYEGQAHYPENYGNGLNTYGAPGFGGPGFNGAVAPQYGPPGYGGGHHGGGDGGYNLNNFNNYNNPATSSVSIKDYSGPGAPYNVGGGYGNGPHGNNNGYGGYDSYANAGNFGHKIRPSNVYGAP